MHTELSTSSARHSRNVPIKTMATVNSTTKAEIYGDGRNCITGEGCLNHTGSAHLTSTNNDGRCRLSGLRADTMPAGVTRVWRLRIMG